MWQFNFAGFFDISRITKCGKIILLQSVTDCYYKVRHLLQRMTVITKWDVTNYMYLKSTCFLYPILILFSEKNHKKQAQMFCQNHSIALHTVQIFRNFILRNHCTWTEKISDCLTGLTFMIYWTWTPEILELPCLTRIGFMLYCSWTWKVLRLTLDSFYDILGLSLKNTWLTYWAQIDFIITKQGCCYVRKVWKLAWIIC